MRVIIAMCLLAACSNQNRLAVDLTRYAAFDRITIHLKGKKTFVIEAPGASTGLLYPRAVRLNGRALAEPRVRYEDVVKGGVLEFELADRPDDSWAHALCP